MPTSLPHENDTQELSWRMTHKLNPRKLPTIIAWVAWISWFILGNSFFLTFTVNELKLDSKETLHPIPFFAKNLLSFMKPLENNNYKIYDPLGTTLLNRLRLSFSHLKKHKFRYNFADTINPFVYIMFLFPWNWDKFSFFSTLLKQHHSPHILYEWIKQCKQHHYISEVKWSSKCNRVTMKLKRDSKRLEEPFFEWFY